MPHISQQNLISGDEIRKKLNKDYSKKVCFIFGAGASSGYTIEPDRRPPVVKEIFNFNENQIVDNILDKSQHTRIRRGLNTLKPRLEKDFNNDLESFLSNLYIKNKEDNRFGQFLIYLYDIFFEASRLFGSESNHYMDLIDHMWNLRGEKTSWSCISFNYDDLFERSYIENGRDPSNKYFNKLEDYIKLEPKFLKPHGGINFRYSSQDLSDNISESNYIFRAFSKMMDDDKAISLLKITGPINLHHLREEKTPYINDVFWPEKGKPIREYSIPLMLIPIHEKIILQNNFFKLMNDLSIQEIKNSDLIISIGYRFNDEEFTKKMYELDLSKKELILVDLNPSDNLLNKFKERGLRDLKIFNGNGFKEFVEAI